MDLNFVLTIAIKYKRRVELIDLCDGINAFKDEYMDFLFNLNCLAFAVEISSSVSDDYKGLMEIDFVASAPYALPLIHDQNTPLQFMRCLRAIIDHALHGEGKQPMLKRRNYANLYRLVEPVSKDCGGILQGLTTIHGTTDQAFEMDSLEANAFQNYLRKKDQILINAGKT